MTEADAALRPAVSATDPTISILLPVRDGEDFLHEAIDSLVSQTFEDFEVIAVDDGSTDDSAAILSVWAEGDPRVLVLRQEAFGIVPALEAARARARGRYIARMDADDVSLPDRFARQLALMEERPDLVGCGCGVEYFPRADVRDGALRYESWINAAVTTEDVERAMFVECPLAHPTFFLRAAALEEVGGYRENAWPEDYDLVLRLWRAGFALAKVPDVLLRWREGADRLSRTDRRYAPQAFLECKVHHLARTLLREPEDGQSLGVGVSWPPAEHSPSAQGSPPAALGSGAQPPGAPAPAPPLRPVVIWGAGPVGKALSKALQAEGVDVRAFVDLDPRKIGQEIHGAPVLDTPAGLALRGPLHLAAVGQAGARDRLVALLTDAGLVALRDFVAVA